MKFGAHMYLKWGLRSIQIWVLTWPIQYVCIASVCQWVESFRSLIAILCMLDSIGSWTNGPCFIARSPFLSWMRVFKSIKFFCIPVYNIRIIMSLKAFFSFLKYPYAYLYNTIPIHYNRVLDAIYMNNKNFITKYYHK